MPQIFLFDVGNVIVNADHAITYKMLEEYGVDPDRAKLFYANDDYLEFSRGKISGRNFYDLLVTKYLNLPLSYEQVVDAHNQHMFAVNKKVKDVLAKLPPGKIAFVTDTNEWQTARERQLIDLTRYSSLIFRSHKIHMLKTDEGFFRYLAQQLQKEPGNLLLIDDSPEKVGLAEASGFSTIIFKDADQLSQALNDLS